MLSEAHFMSPQQLERGVIGGAEEKKASWQLEAGEGLTV